MNLSTFEMTENNRRSKRVASELKTELAWLFEHKLKDPSIGFITITQVKMSPDLKIAKVHYSVLGNNKDRETSGEALKRAVPFLKHELGNRLQLRFLPDLRFYYDDSLDYANKITELINKIHRDENNR